MKIKFAELVAELAHDKCHINGFTTLHCSFSFDGRSTCVSEHDKRHC